MIELGFGDFVNLFSLLRDSFVVFFTKFFKDNLALGFGGPTLAWKAVLCSFYATVPLVNDDDSEHDWQNYCEDGDYCGAEAVHVSGD